MKLNNIALILLFIALANAKLVMIIRHGEKLNDEVTDLSPKGKARAYCLPKVFGNDGIYLTPQKIYAQSPTEKKQSTRPRDTVVPLSEAIGVPVDLSFTSGKVKKLANAIKSSTDEVTLVSWSNDKIPEIAEEFGIVNPPNWGGKTFDEIWMIYDSNTSTFRKNALGKREVYSGTDGYTMEIVKQNIKPCIKENTKNFESTSDATKLSSSVVLALFSLIFYVLF